MTSLFSSRHSSKVSTSRRRLTSPTTNNGAEDLFLNLANDNASKPSDSKSVISSRGHHRRKSIPTPTQAKDSSPAPGTEDESPPRPVRNPSQNTVLPPQPRRANTDAALSGASGLARTAATNYRALNGESPYASSSRRQSLGTSTPNSNRNTLRPSDFAYSTPDASDFTGREHLQAKSSFHADGLGSEASTTAPSAVWEELIELKARMKHLELGGSAVKSRQNGNIVDINERPRTGTTQTTASTRRSSHTEFVSPTTTKITAPDAADLHPLLQPALAKAKNVVARGVYSALENTASDALQMAVLARADFSDMQSAAGSTVDGTGFSQRRMQKKADNLCRDLTELCIALCEANNGSGSPLDSKAAYRPGSRDLNGDAMSVADTNSPLTSFEERRRLADRVERLSSRYGSGASRIADRRDFSQSTVLANRINGRHASIAESSPQSPWAGAGLNRAATTSSHSRPATRDSSANEQSPDRDATLRGPIRSNTDAQRSRPTHSSRGSREYTSQHPLPSQNTSTLSFSTNRTVIPGDRNSGLLSPTSTETPTQTPLSPSRPRDARRRRTASNASSRAPPSTGAGLAERLEAKRQQQVASAQQLRGQEDAMPSPIRPDAQSQAHSQAPSTSSRRRSVGRVVIGDGA